MLFFRSTLALLTSFGLLFALAAPLESAGLEERAASPYWVGCTRSQRDIITKALYSMSVSIFVIIYLHVFALAGWDNIHKTQKLVLYVCY